MVSGGVVLAESKSATTTFTIGNENVEVKATFDIIPETVYTISFNANGGSGEMAEVQVAEGSEYTLPGCDFIAPEGQEFDKWDLGNVGDTIVIIADTVITAQWKDKEAPPEPEPDPDPEPTPEPDYSNPDWLEPYRQILHTAGNLGGKQTAEFKGNFAIPYEFILYLKDDPDVTLLYHVTYEDKVYDIVIPGSNAIADPEIPWYGPLWLLANYGEGQVPTGAKGNGEYIVKAGDTLTKISVELGVTVDYLVEVNGIKNRNFIYVGQIIRY